ncbi:hypothetical protein [Streptomyces sp. NPDC006134]|uniref:hypothetical protein n=1 Tax=Streptomyces sp. NPDC006134 TaxID=3154467 RepID=UPI00340BB0AA
MTSLPPPDQLVAERRSKTSLLFQLILQWIYLPVWGAFAVALGLVVAAASAGLNPPLRWFNPWLGTLSWRRFRAEWLWDAALWDAYAQEKIRKKIARAQGNHGLYKGKDNPDGSYELSVTVPARHFRGIGPERAMAIAASEGWSAELKSGGRDQWNPGALRLSRIVRPHTG